MKTVIGLDIGHSAVKVCAMDGDTKRQLKLIFPSVSIPAFGISDSAEKHRASLETVTLNGRDYFFGETALIQSSGRPPALGLSDDWIETKEYSVLLAGTIEKLRQQNFNLDNPVIVSGLPSSLHQRQKDRLKEITQKVIASNVLVAPQPIGPWQKMMLTEDGDSHPDRRFDESWAVIEIGHYTTDFLLIQDGRWIERGSHSCGGVRIAAERAQMLLHTEGMDVDVFIAEKTLKSRKIKRYGKDIDVSKHVDDAINLISTEIIDTATRLIEPVVHELDGVLLAGGGANIIENEIKRNWPHVFVSGNPRMAVSEGFCRFGLGFEKKAGKTQE